MPETPTFYAWLQAWIPLIKDFFTGVAALVAAYVGYMGLRTWRKQLRGKTEYELAQGLAKAAYKVRNEIAEYRTAFSTLYLIMRATSGTPSDSKDWIDNAVSTHEKHWQKIEDALGELDGIALEAEAIWGEAIATRIAALRQCTTTLFATWHANYWRQKIPSVNLDEKFDNQVLVVIYKVPPENNWFSEGLTAAVLDLTNFLKRYLKI